MINLPLKPILFCDFDGVLCHDRYWRSLPHNEYKKVQELLFKNDNNLINDWMRGRHTSEEINKIISDQTSISFKRLWDTFVEDCKTMNVSKDVLKKLNNLRNKYTVILITSNMDSFTRFTQSSLRLSDHFDYISNSFNEGLLKTDNEGELYVKLANKYRVPIEDCIVFDDSKNVHKVFSELGGTAYLVTPEEDLTFHLERLNIFSH